jgi:membrane protease YdiL (CAAX protease family)
MSSETIPSRFCTKCGSEVNSSAFFCSLCGFSLTGRNTESVFGAFSFHSRWLILVLALMYLASSLSFYLGNIVLAAYIVFVIRRNKVSLPALIGKIPSGYNWWLLALMVIGILAYSTGASVVVMYPLSQLDAEYVNNLMNATVVSESATSAFILLVILAPLLEEMIFRGLLFSRLTKKWGMTRATIVSSLFFGLLHFPVNPIGAALLGIVACVLYVRTRTLWVPITLHAMNNMIVWGLVFTLESGTADFGSAE